jgi:hypothetical protein
LPGPVAVAQAASGFGWQEAVHSGPEALGPPAAEAYSPGAVGSGLTDPGFARWAAAVRSDLAAEVRPVVEAPGPPATEPGRSVRAAPAVWELSGLGSENLVVWYPSGSGSTGPEAWQAWTAPGLPVPTKLDRLSSGFELRFGGYVPCRLLLWTIKFSDPHISLGEHLKPSLGLLQPFANRVLRVATRKNTPS